MSLFHIFELCIAILVGGYICFLVYKVDMSDVEVMFEGRK